MKKKKRVIFALWLCIQILTVTSCNSKGNLEGSQVGEISQVGEATETSEESNDITPRADYISTAQGDNGVHIEYISFDDLAPEGYALNQDWDSMGIDNQDRVYLGWTSKRSDGKEDFVVFRYDKISGERKLIGTLMQASEAAGNLKPDEQIPKGHTRMIYANGKIYIGSQSFHDFKNEIDDLPTYRGSHLYAYDIEKDQLEDISASLPEGVVTKNQGIVAMTYMPDEDDLICLTHPNSDIVIYDINKSSIEKVVPGIPWKLGNPLSREIVATKYGKIYTYRGTEDPKDRLMEFNMYEYDLLTDIMRMTPYKFKNGFWNGQAQTQDRKLIYLSTVNGGLYVMNTESGEITDLGLFIPEEDTSRGLTLNYMYSITISQDEKKLYAIPSVENGDLYEYDIETKRVSRITALNDEIYTGNNIVDSKGNLYFAKFKAWEGECRLMIINLSDYVAK